MTLFTSKEPLLREKQDALDIQDLCGLLQIQWKVGKFTLFSAFYTRIDQALWLWGSIALVIFATAQFFPISWTIQAYLWSILTCAGTVAMAMLTRFWVRVEQLSWIVYVWAGLMGLGLLLTDFGIFFGVGTILLNLCSLWLGLSAIGYFATGLGMRSRTFVAMGIVHLLGIAILPNLMAWQFLFTGILIGGSLFLLSELQWDMRPPIDSPVLSETEKQFNRQQHHRRQSIF
ncbi:hypothetical protein [Baaleninema simplex]|uniref:hypothetical protein n=1 Tax=Baaleninema simplex TaxID=2862350 RepID=UPI00037494DC|nr:hypothetical protein [Baaleninema simplex]